MDIEWTKSELNGFRMHQALCRIDATQCVVWTRPEAEQPGFTANVCTMEQRAPRRGEVQIGGFAIGSVGAFKDVGELCVALDGWLHLMGADWWAQGRTPLNRSLLALGKLGVSMRPFRQGGSR